MAMQIELFLENSNANDTNRMKLFLSNNDADNGHQLNWNARSNESVHLIQGQRHILLGLVICFHACQ